MKKTEKIIIPALVVICIALTLLFYQNWILDNKSNNTIFLIEGLENKIRDLENKIVEAETATEELKR